MLHVVCPLSSWRKSKAPAATSGISESRDGQGHQGQLSFTVESGRGEEPEADLIKSSFSFEEIAPIDSEELIQQICDDIDETDNILTRTSERAVALSLAELAEEPIDPIDQSDLISTSEGGISSCAELDEEGSDVSCASLRSEAQGEPEVRTQIELEIPRNIETGSTDNSSEPEVNDNPLSKSHESSGTVKDL